jgi:hypothetical protein
MKVISHAAQSNLRRFRNRVSKGAGRDGRKTYLLTAKAGSFFNAIAVAAFQYLRLIFLAALPDWPNGMDDITNFEIAGSRGHGMAGCKTASLIVDLAAFFKKSRTGSAMNCPINAAAAEQGRVGGIHNRVSGFVNDIALHQLECALGANPISHSGTHIFLDISERFHSRQVFAFQKFQRRATTGRDMTDFAGHA